MKEFTSPWVGAALCALAAAGCSQPVRSDPLFQSNVPDYRWVAISLDTAAAPDPSVVPAATGSEEPCHPHLYARAGARVAELDAPARRVLGEIAQLVSPPPVKRSPTEQVWAVDDSAPAQRFILQRHAEDNRFDFQWEALAAPGGPYRVLAQGSERLLDGSSSGARSGTLAMDLDALHQIDPRFLGRGRMDYRFDLPAGAGPRQVAVTLSRFVSPLNPGARPLSGQYLYRDRGGRGGTLVIRDQLPVGCFAGFSSGPTWASVALQWLRAPDGTFHGRADALARDSRGHRWEALTCHQGMVPSAQNETYWLSKLEASNDGSQAGPAYESTYFAPTSCDAGLTSGGKSVPGATGQQSDYDFGATFNADGTIKQLPDFVLPGRLRLSQRS